MLADIQGFFGNLFLAAIVVMAIWMHLLKKLGAGGEAKRIAGGWVIRSLRNLFK